MEIDSITCGHVDIQKTGWWCLTFLVVTNTGKTNGFAHWIYVILLELCHFCIHQKWINCKEYVNMSLLGHFLQSPIWLSNFQPMAQVFGGGWADSVRLLDNQDRRHWDFRVFEAPFLDDHTTRPFFWCWCLFGRIHLVISPVGSRSGRDEDWEWPWQERFLHQGLVPRIVGHSLVQALSSVHSVHSEMLGNCRGNDWSVTAATLESAFFPGQ
jgi:hypothetical protein